MIAYKWNTLSLIFDITFIFWNVIVYGYNSMVCVCYVYAGMWSYV